MFIYTCGRVNQVERITEQLAHVWTNMYTTWGLPPSRTYIQASNETHLCFYSLCRKKRERWMSPHILISPLRRGVSDSVPRDRQRLTDGEEEKNTGEEAGGKWKGEEEETIRRELDVKRGDEERGKREMTREYKGRGCEGRKLGTNVKGKQIRKRKEKTLNEKWKKTTEERRKKVKEAKKGTAENKRVDNKRKNNNKRQQRETSKRGVWTRTPEEMRKQEGEKKLLENKWWAKKRGETQRREGRMRKNKNREQDRCRQREQMKERKNAVQICRKNTQGSNTITTWSQRHTFYNQQSFFLPTHSSLHSSNMLTGQTRELWNDSTSSWLKKNSNYFFGRGGLISSHFLLCSPSSGPSLLLIPVFKLPSILQSWGASQIAFVHLLTTRPRDRVCVCV